MSSPALSLLPSASLLLGPVLRAGSGLGFPWRHGGGEARSEGGSGGMQVHGVQVPGRDGSAGALGLLDDLAG